MLKKDYFLSGIILFSTTMAWSDTRSFSLDQFDYPELSVTPRASDRLKMEAAKEAESKWTTYLPVQVSAVSTLLAGAVSFDSSTPQYSLVGIGIGAAWLVATTAMAMTYTPYTTAYQEVASLPQGSTRDKLTRERAAEEAINRASCTGEKMKWLAFLSNLGASVYMMSHTFSSNSTGSSNGAAEGFEVTSLALSFTPLVFGFHWHEVKTEQDEYKKRIYAPVASPTLLKDPSTQKYVPGMVLSMGF